MSVAAMRQSPAAHPSPAGDLNIGMLRDMGFSESQCREALRLAGNQPELAMEWLLQQAALPDRVDDSQNPQSDLNSTFSLANDNAGAADDQSEEVDEAVVGMLVGMGFSRTAVLAALHDCEGDPDAACALLMDGDLGDYEQVDEAEERRSDNAAQLSEQMHLQSTFSAITPHGLQQTVSVATPAQPNFGVSPHPTSARDQPRVPRAPTSSSRYHDDGQPIVAGATPSFQLAPANLAFGSSVRRGTAQTVPESDDITPRPVDVRSDWHYAVSDGIGHGTQQPRELESSLRSGSTGAGAPIRRHSHRAVRFKRDYETAVATPAASTSGFGSRAPPTVELQPRTSGRTNGLASTRSSSYGTPGSLCTPATAGRGDIVKARGTLQSTPGSRNSGFLTTASVAEVARNRVLVKSTSEDSGPRAPQMAAPTKRAPRDEELPPGLDAWRERERALLGDWMTQRFGLAA